MGNYVKKAAAVAMTGLLGMSLLASTFSESAHAATDTPAGQASKTNPAGDTSKPIKFNEAKQMTPKELKEELTTKDKKLHNKDTGDGEKAVAPSAVTPKVNMLMRAYVAPQSSSINDYIKNNNIKPVKIQQDSRINNLPKYSYKSGKYIGVAIHETANPNSTIDGEVNYMYNNYNNAFVHAFVSGNKIVQTAPSQYLAWGAGPAVNAA